MKRLSKINISQLPEFRNISGKHLFLCFSKINEIFLNATIVTTGLFQLLMFKKSSDYCLTKILTKLSRFRNSVSIDRKLIVYNMICELYKHVFITFRYFISYKNRHC